MKKSLNKFIKSISSLIPKKSKGLHDPYFNGNEKKYLANCINSGYVSSVGKYVNIFEKKVAKLTNVKFSVATNSGTSALHLLMKYYNVGPKDEVLLPSLTYVATANAIKYCNSNLNFIDIDKNNLGVCPNRLETYLKKIAKKKKHYYINKKSRKRLKLLIAVHLYGFSCDIEKLKKVCKKYKIILIEDAAEAFGSKFNGKYLGTFAEAGIFSFNGNKPITCGSGGMIVTNSEKIAKNTYHLSVQAKKRGLKEHNHDKIGFNYRMSNLSAAVGCAQLENFSKIFKAKRKNYKLYTTKLKQFSLVKILKEPKNSISNYWLIIALFQNKKIKNFVFKKLRSKGFICRSIWRPLHHLKIFQNSSRDKLSNTDEIFSKSLNLPSSPSITLKN